MGEAAADIVAVARGKGSFTQLVGALEGAGLVEELSSGGPFTLFAPTDEAFAKMSKHARETYMCDSERIRDLLLYHVVDGIVTRDDIRTLGSVRTRALREITFYFDEDKVTVSGQRIVEADIMCSNGVIHAIDGIATP
jgi:uncharacterized surface protein with fasciclin (FAS1) repeats